MRLAFALSFVAGLALAQQSGVPSRGASSSSSTSVSPNAPLNYSTGQANFCIQPIPGVNGWDSTPPEWGLRYASNSSAGAARTPSLGDGRTRSPAVVVNTGAGTMARGGWYTDYSYIAQGSSPYVGGYSLWQRFAKVTPDNGSVAWFAGLGSFAGQTGQCMRPSLVKQDGVMWMCEDGGTNMNLCSWNDAGRACTDMGSDFPCGRNADAGIGGPMFYDTLLTAPPATGSIGYYAQNLMTGAETSGSITQNLPNSDVLLQWTFEICNGDAGSQIIELMTACFNNYSMANGGTPSAYDGGTVALDAGLVAYWAFEDGGLSSTGDKNLAMAASIGVNADAGFIGLGADFSLFDGGFAQVEDGGLVYTAAQARSVSMWAVTRDRTAVQVLYGTPSTNATLYLSGTTFYSWSANILPYSPVNNVWTHYVFTYTPGGVTAMYVNGRFTGAASQNIALTLLWIGAVQTGGYYWQGYIDEVGVWNRALTPNEVAALYNNGAGFRPL